MPLNPPAMALLMCLNALQQWVVWYVTASWSGSVGKVVMLYSIEKMQLILIKNIDTEKCDSNKLQMCLCSGTPTFRKSLVWSTSGECINLQLSCENGVSVCRH